MSYPFANVKLALISGLCVVGGFSVVQAGLAPPHPPAPMTSSTTARPADANLAAEPVRFDWGTRRPEPQRSGGGNR